MDDIKYETDEEYIFSASFDEERGLMFFPTGEPIVRCKHCKYQRKIWHSDRRRKDGGYTIYGCGACEYAPLGYDTDYCSYGEREEDVTN